MEHKLYLELISFIENLYVTFIISANIQMAYIALKS